MWINLLGDMNDDAVQKPSLLDRLDRALTSNTKWIYILFAAALFLKLLYVIQSSGDLHITVPIMDSKYYDKEAQDIARGHLVRTDAFFMGPLYPYVLAGIYAIFGRDFMVARLIQIAVGSLTVVMTYLLGKEVFRPSAALAGAVMLALYGSMTFHESEILMEWLGTFINTLTLLVLYRMPTKPDWLKYAIAGFLVGLSALARANILFFLPVVVAWPLLAAGESRRVQKALVVVSAAAVAILPATIHNYAVSKDFVPITSNGGVNFYIGNGEEATGIFYPAKGITFETEESARSHVERIFGRDMKPSEVSRYWFGEAFKFIKAHPVKEARLLVRKTAIFFNAYEVPQIESFEIARAEYPTLRVLFVNFWTVVSLGLLGMIMTARSWRRYFLLHGYVVAYALSIIVFFVTARYRIQVVPVVCIFAGYSLVVVLPEAVRHMRKRISVLVLFLLIVFLTRPSLFALPAADVEWREHIHEARRLSETDKHAQALEEIDKAVGIHPDVAESYSQRAIVRKEAGDYFKAIEDYSRALKIRPDMPDVRYDLAQALRKVRMYGPAIEEYEKTIALDPVKAEAYNNLGITYMEMGNLDKAIEYFSKVIEMDTGYIKAYNNLGAALAQKGEFDKAITVLTRAVRVDPSYANSYKNLAMVYIQLRKPREAYDFLSRYRELKPDDKKAAENLAKLRIAIDADTAGRDGSTGRDTSRTDEASPRR